MSSPNSQAQKRICIGKISSAHGVKGLVKIMPYCEDISLLNGNCFINEHSDKTISITLKNSLGKYILAKIEGITTPEDAKELKHSLFVPRETLPEIDDKDEFYIEDLVNINVIDHESKEPVGSVIAVSNFGAGDLLEIKPAKGGASYYLPFKEEYVTSIDIESGVITVKDAELFQMG